MAQERDRARAEFDRADPEATRSDLLTAERAVKLSSEQRDTVNSRVTDLRGELRSQGQSGLGEKRQELIGKLEAARRRADLLDRQAGAIALLKRVLEGAASDAREHFLQPIADRVAPLLRRLFPNYKLVLSDNLDIPSLDRGGVQEPFANLSIGTREQLAILTRLAFAQLLIEKGQPAMVVLDDALVYSDEDRFERMKLILSQAAQHYQVLILTRRPGDYISVGALIIALG